MNKTVVVLLSSIVFGFVVVGVGGVYAVPYVAMHRVEQRFIASASGVNHIIHGHRATAASNAVVRSSPDQLHSACVFDVSNGPVEIGGRVPSSYYSISLYAQNSSNFFSRNDRDLASSYRLLLVGKDEPRPQGVPERQIVTTPSKRGIVLIRLIIPDAERLSQLKTIQRSAFCRPFKHTSLVDPS